MADRQPPKAQDKLAFLLALVPYLMDHDRVSVAEAAEHFEVPPEQLREAVRLIAVSGVPGETASYQHGDLFDIAWDDFEDNDQIVLTNMVAIDDSPRFSAREAAALIAGLQYLSSLPEHADRAAISTLMAKLTRGSSASPSAGCGAGVRDGRGARDLIHTSVERGVQVEFDYQSSRGERERRRVDPLRVESVDADWYLRGWCHLREAVRTFRLDRIAYLSHHRRADHPRRRRCHPARRPCSRAPPTTCSSRWMSRRPRCRCSPTTSRRTRRRSGRGTGSATTVRVSHVHGLKRLIASMPGVAVVVSPKEARAAVADWARAGAERYGALTMPWWGWVLIWAGLGAGPDRDARALRRCGSGASWSGSPTTSATSPTRLRCSMSTTSRRPASVPAVLRDIDEVRRRAHACTGRAQVGAQSASERACCTARARQADHAGWTRPPASIADPKFALRRPTGVACSYAWRMFGNAFGWPHLLIILAVVLLLFGAPKLPGLAKSIGQSMRIFRSEVKTMKDDGTEDADADSRRTRRRRRAEDPEEADDEDVVAMATRSARWRNRSDERMSLGQHLLELRKRIFISAIAIVIGAVVAFVNWGWVAGLARTRCSRSRA